MAYKFWTIEEINLLKDCYLSKGLSSEEIAVFLHERTPEGIWLKIKKLKLRHSPEQTSLIKKRLNTGENNGMFGKKGPNKGLTVFNSERIKKAGEKISLLKKEGFKTGLYIPLSGSNNPMYGKTTWRKGLTKFSSEKIREAGKKCSQTHKNAWQKLSEEEKEKKSIFLASLFQKHKRGKKVRTSIELTVEKILNNMLIKFIPSHPIGRFFVDFYLTEYNSVIECFGDYWHCNPLVYKTADKYQAKNIERDIRKKIYLKNNKMPFLLLWEKDIKNSPDLQSIIKSFIDCQRIQYGS